MDENKKIVEDFKEKFENDLKKSGFEKNLDGIAKVAENHFMTDLLSDDNSEGALDFLIEELEPLTDKAIEVADIYFDVLEEFKNA